MRRRFIKQDGFNFNDYLTIEALEDGLTISINGPYQFTYEYCIDGDGMWIKLPNREVSMSINSGQKFYVKADGIYHYSSSGANSVGQIYISKRCKLSGNCLSLWYGDKANGKGLIYLDTIHLSFAYLFQNCTTIEEVSDDFLPATTLTVNCYSHMFYGCTGLATAPTLPATTLTVICYSHMFYGCTKLNYIKMLATDISADHCLNNWVSGVSPTGTFIKNPDAEWDVRGVNGIPEGWTVKFDGEEEPTSINLETTITDGYGEYTNEQVLEVVNYIRSEYGDSYNGPVSDFKYTFNGYAIEDLYFVLSGTQYLFIANFRGGLGMVEFGNGYNYIAVY